MDNNFIMMGPAGSGKGTQAELIAKKYDIPHISIGLIFRELEKHDTKLGREVKQMIDKGVFVPDEITNQIILDKLNEDECQKGFVLDGYPRSHEQAEFLEKHRQIKKAILLEISEEECIRRMLARRVCSKCKAEFNTLYIKPKKEGICDKCGGKLVQREDDNPEAIKERLDKFHNITRPVIEFYEKKGVLLRVNGEQPIEKVFEELKEKLGV